MNQGIIGRRALLSLAGALAASPALISTNAWAEKKYGPGVTDTEIKIGNTMPYSGNASAYGSNGRAEAAYFRMINDQGGINGRMINFISLDDGYSPPKTMELTRQLVERDQVLLMFAPLGTAPNTAIHKYMNQKKVPHLFVGSGASKWGDPEHFPWTIGLIPDYHGEGYVYAKHILKTQKDPKIAVLRQNDDVGVDYLTGFREGLGAQADKLIVLVATYEVTDPTVDSQMLQLKNSGANVFFNITTPKFAAQAIKKSGEINWKPVHYLVNISASLAAVIRPAGQENSEGTITALYSKDVTDSRWADSPDVKAWRAFMAKYMPNADIAEGGNAVGYAFAYTLGEVLKRCGDDLTRENVMRQATSLKNLEVPLMVPGNVANTSPTDFYPLKAWQMSRMEGGHWIAFGDLMKRDER
jgi:branched-chain amino acid transport system substrate-binding protein